MASNWSPEDLSSNHLADRDLLTSLEYVDGRTGWNWTIELITCPESQGTLGRSPRNQLIAGDDGYLESEEPRPITSDD